MRQKTISEKIFSKKTVAANEEAIKSYEIYKRANEVIEEVKTASGKKGSFRLTNNSTINTRISTHGITSTQQI